MASLPSTLTAKRYYRRVADRLPPPAGENAPKFEDRPMHCDKSEPFSHTLKSKYAGLGVSSLQKAYYFACSTPHLSPPALSTSLPTDVQTTTVKYMQPFLKERNLQDPLPSSWKLATEPLNFDSLVSIEKNSIHFYDGDSAEVTLSEHSCQHELRQLETKPGTIRIRMLHQDAPEVKFSVRIYKQSTGSTSMTSIATRHIGIESLRAIREIVFDASSVYLQVPKDSNGKPIVSLDLYGRRLMNIFVKTNLSAVENVTELLASRGYTLSYYTSGIACDVNAKMRDAINNKLGMFTLPDELFVYPFRPWDLRKLWPDTQAKPPTPFEEFRPICNAASQQRPELVWRSTTTQNPEDATELLEADSQDGDKFFFRIVPNSMQNESLCFIAPSTINGAGQGLFLKPHALIPKGSHLCLYSEQPTTPAEMDKSNSSRDYAVQTSKCGTWYDAEREQANNLGRFANQPCVLEMLLEIKDHSNRQSGHDQMAESDWKLVEDKLIDHCNAEYCSANREMVLRAKRDLQPTRRPEEIFTYYGGLRTYWVNAINSSPPTKYGTELFEIVDWLMTSPDCNWTATMTTITTMTCCL